MSTMIGPKKGIIRGTMIELSETTRIPDGSEVSVSIQVMPPSNPDSPLSEGLQSAFGGWSDDPEGLEEFLEWNRQQRKQTRRELPS